jgi:DNA-directed RNA polymerase III subunit RPC4
MMWGNPDEDGEGVIEMEVNRGTPCEFLQEVVVMKDQSPYGEQDVDEKGRPKGVAYSLGQVKGKYVVSPEFMGLIKTSSGKKPAGKGKEKEKKVEIVVED